MSNGPNSPIEHTTPAPPVQPAPVPVVVAPANPASLWSIAIRWALGQEATTLFLAAILGAIGWFAKYVVDVAVPKHLQSIQQGYTEINEMNIRDRAEERAATEKSIERTDKLLEKIFSEQKSQGKAQKERDKRADAKNKAEEEDNE